VREVGYLQGSYQDARPKKRKKYFSSYVMKKYQLGSTVGNCDCEHCCLLKR